MRRQRLAFVVAAVQVTFTAILTYWADRVDWLQGGLTRRVPPPYPRVHYAVVQLRKIWRGVNAPTIPLNSAGTKQFMILGFSIPEILYLFAVAVLWYWIVRSFRQPYTYTSAKRESIKSLALIVWGVILMFVAVDQAVLAFARVFPSGRLFYPITFITAFPYATWSLVLVARGINKLRVVLGKRKKLPVALQPQS